MNRLKLRLNWGAYTVWWRTLVVLLIWSAAAAAAEGEQRLTILHTNDLLGRLLPEPYFDEADWAFGKTAPSSTVRCRIQPSTPTSFSIEIAKSKHWPSNRNYKWGWATLGARSGCKRFEV